jgi:hypothetical protein
LAGLQALRAHPAWHRLVGLLERVAQAEYDRLGQGLSHDEYLAQVGAYQASRRAVDLVDNLLEKAKDDDDSAKRATESKRDHTRAITFGSPHWRG